jgi:hypothetical protein
MEPSRDELKKPIEVKKSKDTPPPDDRGSPPRNKPTSWWRKLFGKKNLQLPLLHYTWTTKSGAPREIMIGPEAVKVYRLTIWFLLILILILKNPALAEALLKWVH